MTRSPGHTAAERPRRILRRLFGERPEGLAVRLWDGTVRPAATGSAQATLILTHPGALRSMLAYPLDVTMGENRRDP